MVKTLSLSFLIPHPPPHSVRKGREKSSRIYSVIFILSSPSWDFIFNYDELSWRSLSDNTDNKLHICDNHLGWICVWERAWEKFECSKNSFLWTTSMFVWILRWTRAGEWDVKWGWLLVALTIFFCCRNIKDLALKSLASHVEMGATRRNDQSK